MSLYSSIFGSVNALAAGTNACHANWVAGWSLILLAFLVGAVIGLKTHRDDYLGGYASYRRRMVRLGHIALAALGMLNVLFSLSPLSDDRIVQAASLCLIGGAVCMPTTCFLSAWREPLRRFFFIPVTLLLAGVVLTLIGGCR